MASVDNFMVVDLFKAKEMIMEAILERVSVGPTVELQFNTLAKDAAAQLGYSVAAHQSEDTRVLMELISIGCAPYTDEGVKRYQTKMRRKSNAHFRISLQTAFSLSGMLFIACGILRNDIMLFMAIGFLAVGTFLAMLFSNNWNDWQMFKIDKYNSPIPKAILEKALMVKKHFTTIQTVENMLRCDVGEQVPICSIDLYVSELGLAEKVYDPFLVVKTMSGKDYYIAVWDEPTFENKVGE